MPEQLPDRLSAALYQFFHRLRHDLQTQLGVGEYKLLFDALQNGASANDAATMLRLCRTIWLKDQSQYGAFRERFDNIVAPAFQEATTAKTDENTSETTTPKPPAPEPEKALPLATPPPPDAATLSDEEAIARIPDTADASDEDFSLSFDGQGALALESPVAEPQRDLGISTHRFILSERYLPIALRDMQQHWRFLQNNFERGITPQIDLPRTVAAIAQRGMLLAPVFQKHVVNRTHLLFLIDDSASMIAFDTLAQRLVEAALEDPFVTEEEVFYFNNFPENHLYHNPYHTEAEPLASLWRRCHRHTIMLIVSDGGASRGAANFERIRATNAFLKNAQRHVRRVAWLNPMPRARWEETSADYIARRVPMFETDRMGLYKAIQTLKGKVF